TCARTMPYTPSRSVIAIERTPSRCASSRSSSGWLAPSRNEKFDLHQRGAYTCASVQVSSDAVKPPTIGRGAPRPRVTRGTSERTPMIEPPPASDPDAPHKPPEPRVQVHHRGERGVDGILRLIELAGHEGPLEAMLTAMCGEIAAIASADV